MQILDGKLLSDKVKDEVKTDAGYYIQTPILAIISIGNDESSNVYIRSKKKACEDVGISMIHFHFSSNESENKIIKKIKELNKDKTINGIIVQLPIPNTFDKYKIINTISPIKDVDGLTDVSKSSLFTNNPIFIPCTPKGILEILDYYKIDLEGKNVVIIGRSELVGMPMMIECIKRNATVTICHSHTKDLKEHTKNADILIVACGKKYLINKSMVKKDSIVIDVGINKVNGKIYGDVNPNVKDKVSLLTPVPGGVGLMTVSMLMRNTLTAYQLQNQDD